MTVRSAAASELRQRELQLQAENTTLRNALQQLRKQLPDQVASNPPLSDVGGGGRGAGIPDSNQQIANMKLVSGLYMRRHNHMVMQQMVECNRLVDGD